MCCVFGAYLDLGVYFVLRHTRKSGNIDMIGSEITAHTRDARRAHNATSDLRLPARSIGNPESIQRVSKAA